MINAFTRGAASARRRFDRTQYIAEHASSFFWPRWYCEGVEALFCQNREFPKAYSFRLWEGESRRLTKGLDANSVMMMGTTYNKIAGKVVDVDLSPEGLVGRGRSAYGSNILWIERPDLRRRVRHTSRTEPCRRFARRERGRNL